MLRFAALVAAGFLCLAAQATCADPADHDDDAPPQRLPGLVAVYSHAESGVEFRRYEAIPACELSVGQAPDPRLPATGWRVHFSGAMEILRPGKYRFAVASTGRVALRIAGRAVPLADGPLPQGFAAEAAIDLPLGLQRIECDYEPLPGEPARLKLFWQSDWFDPEPLPSQSLGHEASDPPVVDEFFRGRLLVEEHSCVACHGANDKTPLGGQLATRPGPRLTAAGARLKAGWIYHWLADPTALRPEAVMPQLFSADPRGDVERYAVATFLASEGGPVAIVPDPPAEVILQSSAAGAELFQRIGCAVCHERQENRPARATLKALSQKTTPEAIEAFLQKPESVAPAGGMPAFVLGKLEKRQLALHLFHHDAAQTGALELPAAPTPDDVRSAFAALAPSDAERADFAPMSPAQQLSALGRQVMRARNCVACHELKPSGEELPWKPVTSRFDFAAIAERPSAGCLAAGATSSEGRPLRRQPRSKGDGFGDRPQFGASLDRAAVSAFLTAAARAPATPAPVDAARVALARMNCLACHERDGLGGLTQGFITRISGGTDAASELVTPPSLTQVTAKLSVKALRGVLEGNERSRPWMSLQMPHFAKEAMHGLPAHLAALDAQPFLSHITAETAAAVAPEDATVVEAGRTLVGSRGFGCTKCHDMLGVPSTGTRGPDLANVYERIDRAWYSRWMHDPQRIQPGTRMPTVFLNGESPYKDVLDGDPARQREAIWQYLAVARSLPPPEGLEQQKVQTLAGGTLPVAVRTFLPSITPRGIAVRFPNEVHVAFDAQTCRLAYAWSGEFLDMGPVWNGRGGHIAHLLGKTLWTAPAGCPWEITSAGAAPPSFAGRGEDPSLGALLRDGKLHPSRLAFVGYNVDATGPVFRYRLAFAEGMASFSERVTSLRGESDSGVLREFSLAAPAETTIWLHAADSASEPQWIAGETVSAVRAGEERAATACSLRVEQDGQPMLLRLRAASTSAEWVITLDGDRWHVLLRLAASAAGGDRTAAISIRRPNDPRPDSWQRLLAEEIK